MIWWALLTAWLLALWVSPAAAATSAKWRHAVFPPRADTAFQLMAKKKGYFQEAGLDVEFINLASETDMTRGLIAGELDTLEGSPGSPLAAIASGASLRIVGGYLTGVPHLLYVRKEVNGPKDLEGKTIGVSAHGDLPHVIVATYLKRNGVDPARVNWVALGRDATRFQSLVIGKIDATASNLDFIPLLPKNPDVKVLVGMNAVVPEYLRYTLITSAKTLNSRSADLANFAIAYGRGVRYALEHRDETIALALEVAKGTTPEAAALVYDTFVKDRLIDPDFRIPPKKIAFMQEINLSTGRQKMILPYEQVATDAIQQQVLKVLGPYRR